MRELKDEGTESGQAEAITSGTPVGCIGIPPSEGTERTERVSACTSVRGCRDVLPDEGTESF